jgi:carbamoyl-phosphate synthase large subunit
MKILVTGAGALLGQGIIRSLRSSSLAAQIVAVDPSPLAAGLYWADAAHLVPLASSRNYLPALRAVLDRERPDAVLIGTDAELTVLAACRDELEAEYQTHVVVSNPRVVAIADDKWLTNLFLKAHGFDYPRSCLPGGEESLIEEVGFPLVVKPRRGARSIGLNLVHDRAALKTTLAAVPNAIVQECVGTADVEFTAGTLSFAKECISIVMRRELRDGNTYRAFAEEYAELNQTVRAMANALQPIGPANFQFRLEGGHVKVFEINARFSGTTPLRDHAGFNEVEMTLRHVLLGEALSQPIIRPVVILRHWSETVVDPAELVESDAENLLPLAQVDIQREEPVSLTSAAP